MNIRNKNATNYAPIALFCYNRADKVRTVLKALETNPMAKESDLFIFCDKNKETDLSKKVDDVYDVIENIDPNSFKKILIKKQETNLGIINSIKYGINTVLKNHDKIIVIEDDILPSNNFLEFMNKALEFYKSDKNIFSINGYSYYTFKKAIKEFNYKKDVFFTNSFCPWGWGTWQNRWKKIDFDVKDIESFKKDKKSQIEFDRFNPSIARNLINDLELNGNAWDFRVNYHCFKNNLQNVRPIQPIVKNIGVDGTGFHHTRNKDIYSKFNKFEFKSYCPSLTKYTKPIAEINYDLQEIFNSHHIEMHKLYRYSKCRIRNLIIGSGSTLMIVFIILCLNLGYF